MGLFDWLPGRGKKAVATEVQELLSAVECPHTTLTARWDSVHDMGIEEKAIAFVCAACRETFTAEEGRALRETEAERLRQIQEAADAAAATAEAETEESS